MFYSTGDALRLICAIKFYLLTFLLIPPLLSSSPPFPLAVGPLYTLQLEGLGERCRLPSGVWSKPQPTNDLCILESKRAALVASVFVDFPKKKCNFLHTNKLDIVYGRSSSSQGGTLR